MRACTPIMLYGLCRNNDQRELWWHYSFGEPAMGLRANPVEVGCGGHNYNGELSPSQLRDAQTSRLVRDALQEMRQLGFGEFVAVLDKCYSLNHIDRNSDLVKHRIAIGYIIHVSAEVEDGRPPSWLCETGKEPRWLRDWRASERSAGRMPTLKDLAVARVDKAHVLYSEAKKARMRLAKEAFEADRRRRDMKAASMYAEARGQTARAHTAADRHRVMLDEMGIR